MDASDVGLKAPIQVDMGVKGQDTGLYDTLHTDLSRYLYDCWQRAKTAKTEITERLLKCERQRRGVYDPDRAMEIAKTGGSDIFLRLTDIKCRAAESWIRDVMLGNNRDVFTLDPANEPEMPPEISAGIVELVQMEMQDVIAQGQEIHPEAFRVRMEQVHGRIIQNMRDEAATAAKNMHGKIEDQMNQGGFTPSFKEFINDFVTYPVAIMSGPTVRRKKVLRWGPGFQPIVVNDFVREFGRVSPHDAFPSPSSTSINDGYFFVRHRLTRSSLQDLRGVQGYVDSSIDQVLDRFGEQGFREWLMGDHERERLEGKSYSQMFTREVIEALEFWGSVSGKTLISWGLKKDIEPNKEYAITAWMIGPLMIKVAINPDPLGRRPYGMAQWNEVPGSFWGVALPEQMRDIQIMCNASARSLANNMSIASGPQVEIQIDRLPDGESVTSIFPWKVWQTTSDRTGGGQPAVKFFQPGMNAEPLMAVLQYFSRQADEVTGIPAYLYSGQTGSGAGRTASGLSMLMDNAAKGIKNAIGTIDVVVSGIVQRLYNHNMIYDDDISAKGDFKIVAHGATGLIVKEQLQAKRAEFLAATANEFDMGIIGVQGRAYLLHSVAESLQMDTRRLVPSDEELAQKQMAAQGAGQEGAAQVQAIQQQAQEQIAALQQEAGMKIQELEQTIQALEQQMANKRDEIDSKAGSEIQKAEVMANASIEVARIQATAKDELAPVIEQIKQVQQEIYELRIEEAAKMQVIEKDINDIRQMSEKDEAVNKRESQDENVSTQVLATLAQTQAALAQVMAAPRQTKIIEDKDGRAVGATSTIGGEK